MMPGLALFHHAASLFERGDLPSGAVPPGIAPVVTVGAAPQHPSNTVVIQLRPQGRSATLLRAIPEAAPFQAAHQWYQATLPTLGDGHSIDYQVQLIRAGQRLATLPADGSWLTVIGDRNAAAMSGKRSPVHSIDNASPLTTPCWAYDLTFFATLIALLRPEAIGETPEGYRINFFIRSGRFVGSQIDAVVRPEGGDFLDVRSDGIARPNISISLETADGALVLYRAAGVCDLGPDGYAKIAAGQFTGTHPFYATPTFITAHPNWTWLNRCQGFGIGRVVLEDLRVECDIYFPQVLERRSDG